MNRPSTLRWAAYVAALCIVAAAHSCAVERDQQATPTTTATRSA
ncbi:MAG: hypothetical protein V4468_03600 [Pseudomonadota bacterium]